LTQAFELLETLRWTPQEGWYLLERHLARLEGSARHFGFAYRLTEIRAALETAVVPADRPQRVRLLLAGNGAVRVEAVPLELNQRPLTVRFAAGPIDPSDTFLFHKTTNRRVYDSARLPGCDDVILWNPAGDVTETTIANLVVEVGGHRVTPPVECGLLAGTLRAELLAAGEVAEARVTKQQVRTAPALWLVNSVRGWSRAVLLEASGAET
jgi:branched-subunit amino acid aminotransferase/4-amino-4-deoxychorismate lyase